MTVDPAVVTPRIGPILNLRTEALQALLARRQDRHHHKDIELMLIDSFPGRCYRSSQLRPPRSTHGTCSDVPCAFQQVHALQPKEPTLAQQRSFRSLVCQVYLMHLYRREWPSIGESGCRWQLTLMTIEMDTPVFYNIPSSTFLDMTYPWMI